MHPLIAARKQGILGLCRRFHVKRLEIFGSAAAEDHPGEPGDFDFIVDFALPADASALDIYFGLKESLEQLLGRRVDLVMPSALGNPYFRAGVDRHRQALYGA